MNWIVRLLKVVLWLFGLGVMGLAALLMVPRMLGWTSKPGSASPDTFWEIEQQTQGALKLTAAAPEAIVTLRLESSYPIDNFRFQRSDMTVLGFESSSTSRDPLCFANSNRGYTTSGFFCPPVDHGECIAKWDYPPKSGQSKTQSGNRVAYLNIPTGTARPDLLVQVTHVETGWKSEPRPFDFGFDQYVNYIFGQSQAQAVVQTVGNFVSTFQVKLTLTDPAKGDRDVQWKAIANSRSMWGIAPTPPADARLTITQVK